MQPAQRVETRQSPNSRRRAFSTRKRRAGWAVLAMLSIVLLVGGIYGWQVISALVHLEQAAVVPLPPSTVSTTQSGQPVVSLPSTAALMGDSEPDFGADYTDQASAEASPVAESTPAGDAPANEHLSRLEVAQTLVEASMDNGDPGKSSIWEGRDSLLIMVLGVDRRPDGGDQNADVIIIARLDLIDKTLTGVSIPRDLLVEIPGEGEGKINGAYNAGVLNNPDDPAAGVAKVRDTLESLFGLRIDGYVLVDFSGFESIVDALGGIDVVVPYEIVDTKYPTEDYGEQTITFAAGPQHMDGDQALKYVRTRHADSDDARRQRQIDVIGAILKQGRSLSSITRADDLIVSAAETIQTSFTLEEQLTLARLAMQMSPDNVAITTLAEPLLQADWTDDGAWVYTADPQELFDFVQAHLYPQS
ncbi:MAG: LCP family protein [Thermomicrobiales bacterium]|nr:LCP family protein [Thermomicrobiales bacterium]